MEWRGASGDVGWLAHSYEVILVKVGRKVSITVLDAECGDKRVKN